MSLMIKDIPLLDRPRERLKNFGVESLSNEELLSIILRSGTRNKSVMELSYEILGKINIHDFANISYQGFKNISGIGEVKAMTVAASLEFARRVYSKKDNLFQIKTGEDVFDCVKDDMANELQEKFMVLFLDNRKQLLMKKTLFIGTVSGSRVHPRDVFREAVKCNACSIILVHNHPAGSLYPSAQDIFLTNQFIKIGNLMEIKVLDHLIVTNDGFYSFLEKNGDLFETTSK